MRDTYKRFIECGVPGTACNLRCSYCYVGQKATFTNQDLIHRTMIKYRYAPAIVGKALAKERLGGCAYINVYARSLCQYLYQWYYQQVF